MSLKHITIAHSELSAGFIVLDALLVMPGTSKNQTLKQTYDDFIIYAMLALCSQNWFQSSVP